MNWQLYNDADVVIAAMAEAASKALRSIDIEMFIFSPEHAAGALGNILIERALKGIRVRILVDGVGSYELIGSRGAARMRAAGVQIEFFRPISLWRLRNFTSWYSRNHRKIFIVDSKIAFTGGANIMHFHLARRDSHVRIEGDIVADMQFAFDRMWSNTKDSHFSPFGRTPVREGFQFLTHSPHRRERHLLRECIRAIISANTSICITTPYFVPSLRITAHLRAAVKRGVDVRILLPQLSDHTVADVAARSYVGPMLAMGIKFYFYKPHYMHAKVVVVDESFGMVGSLNIDNLSFLYNYEAGIIGRDQAFARALREQFITDLANSREVTKESWRRRSLKDKILEVLSWPIHFAV